MRLRFSIGIRLLACAAVLAGTGCAQMFNSGASELVLENPSNNRNFDAPAKTDFSRLKIDPLMLADVDTPATESSKVQPTYDRLGIRKPLSQLEKSGPAVEAEPRRSEPIVDSEPEPSEAASNIRKPILLRARQIETKNLPPAEEELAQNEVQTAPMAETNFIGSESSLLSPQPTSGGGDFVASAPRESNRNVVTAKTELAKNPVRIEQAPSGTSDRCCEPVKTETNRGSSPCPMNPQDYSALNFGFTESGEIICPDRSISRGDQASGSDCLCLRSLPNENDQEVDVESTADEGFLEKLIAASVGMESIESIELASNELETITLPSEPARASSHPPASPLNWRGQLGATIEVFESEIEQTEDEALAEQLGAGLTILQALEQNFAAGLDGDDQSFDEIRHYWAHQIQAINELLKKSGEGDPPSRSATRALLHLQDAVHELAALADLKLPFAIFCTKVAGYGQYQPFESVEFRSNQDVLVYCEIDNFAPLLESHDGITNYQTRLSSSFWIADDADLVVQQQDFPVVTDDARNLRRDFFMHLPVTLADLPPGEYRLHVKVRDHGSGKVATLQQPLKFSVH